MRLARRERDGIVAVLDSRLRGRQARLYLFGSRTQDHLRGGDIDLLLVAPAAAARTLRDEKQVIFADFKKTLGDRRIDLVVAGAGAARKDPFVRRVLRTAVLLTAWTGGRSSSLPGRGTFARPARAKRGATQPRHALRGFVP